MLAPAARRAARPVLAAAPRRFHLFRGPDRLALAPGSRASRARDAIKGAVDGTVTADGLWHLNRLAILATCNPAISWEGLRVMLTGTSVLSLVYFGVSGADPKPRKMLWSALFVCLQGAALCAVVADLVPAPLAPDERRCFEANFEPYGLRSRAFRALLDAGDAPRDAAPGDALLREGAINERLHLVLAGRVGVWRGGERLALVDADAGDRGALFGEVGYLFGERRDATHYGSREFELAARAVGDEAEGPPPSPRRVRARRARPAQGHALARLDRRRRRARRERRRRRRARRLVGQEGVPRRAARARPRPP